MANESLFKEELSKMNWDRLYNSNDTTFQYKYFSDVLNEKYDKNVPVKKFKVIPSNFRRPWITSAILKSIKRKNKLYKQKIKNPTEKNIRHYTEYRNRLNHLITYSKTKYYENLPEKSQGNLHGTWNAINEILNKRKTITSNVSFLEHNGKCYKDNNSMAPVFNNFFTNVGPFFG